MHIDLRNNSPETIETVMMRTARQYYHSISEITDGFQTNTFFPELDNRTLLTPENTADWARMRTALYAAQYGVQNQPREVYAGINDSVFYADMESPFKIKSSARQNIKHRRLHNITDGETKLTSTGTVDITPYIDQRDEISKLAISMGQRAMTVALGVEGGASRTANIQASVRIVSDGGTLDHYRTTITPFSESDQLSFEHDTNLDDETLVFSAIARLCMATAYGFIFADNQRTSEYKLNLNN